MIDEAIKLWDLYGIDTWKEYQILLTMQLFEHIEPQLV